MGFGARITLNKTVLVVLGVFLVNLMQGLPASRLPTFSELYVATFAAGLTTLLLLLKGGDETGIPAKSDPLERIPLNARPCETC